MKQPYAHDDGLVRKALMPYVWRVPAEHYLAPFRKLLSSSGATRLDVVDSTFTAEMARRALNDQFAEFRELLSTVDPTGDSSGGVGPEGPGVAISNFTRVSPRKLADWYMQRVHTFTKIGKISTRAEDVAAAKVEFGPSKVTKRMVHEVRKTLAPAHWQRRGRRKNQP